MNNAESWPPDPDDRRQDRCSGDIEGLVALKPGLIAYDSDWQFPAITERHAWTRLSSASLRISSEPLYVAYPWATLIDKMHKKAADAGVFIDRFKRFCDVLPRDVTKVTVCQHILGRRYADLFRQAGIDDVFWSHATHDDVARARAGGEGPGFHPFPLYPVQVPEALPEAAPEGDAISRRYLFSFIGARANQYYLTETRNRILDLLGSDPRGLILGRDHWHYQKIVYDFQINDDRAQSDAAKLVDEAASEQFRHSLLRSVFSLCPAGTGPNSIRLWESIGAGAIPVILADTWAPPGDRRLWDMAAVFCGETPENIKELPDRLAEIASDPARLTRMRHAMRQIWLLYGPQGFVTDVQEFLLSAVARKVPHANPSGEEPAWDEASLTTAARDPASLLLRCAAEMLLNPAAMQSRLEGDISLVVALEKARASLPANAAVLRHYEAVMSHTRCRIPAAAFPRPALQHKAPPRICFLGRHSHRTPLSYTPIRRLIGERLRTVQTPAEADIVVTGFNIDLRENVDNLRPVLESPRPPRIAVFSEEPLWDISWSGPFTGREGRIAVDDTEIAYAFLGHETSGIYDFDRIPYFVLTADAYAVRYANLMSRFAAMTPGTLLDRWRRAAVPAAFFAEHRKREAYSRSYPERDVAGLSVYRTEVAERTQASGVLRVGKGWGDASRRQDLPDWHLDKLARLDGRTRVLGAYENVHQRLYVTEKVFDAFAVGAVPTYWAGPKHRIFELVPQTAMLNTFALDPSAAAERIASFSPDRELAESWLDTCAKLARLFGNHRAVMAERQRVADAVMEEVTLLTSERGNVSRSRSTIGATDTNDEAG